MTFSLAGDLIGWRLTISNESNFWLWIVNGYHGDPWAYLLPPHTDSSIGVRSNLFYIHVYWGMEGQEQAPDYNNSNFLMGFEGEITIPSGEAEKSWSLMRNISNSQITSFIQRAKIVHVTPGMSKGRRFVLFSGEKGTNPTSSLVQFQDEYWPRPPRPGQVAGQINMQTVPHSNREYIIQSKADVNFEDLKLVVGGTIRASPLRAIEDMTSTNSIGQFDVAIGSHWGTGTSTIIDDVCGIDEDHLLNGPEPIDRWQQGRDGDIWAGSQDVFNARNTQMIQSVKNQTAFKIMGGDDVIEETITTNLPPMINRKWIGMATNPSSEALYNNFFASGNLPLSFQINDLTVFTDGATMKPYYPTIYNPPIPKLAWNNQSHMSWISSAKPLKHHFLTMIPIRQNGAVVNQRANFMFEQSTSMTFHFTEEWEDEGDDNWMSGCDIRGILADRTIDQLTHNVFYT